MKIRCGSHQQNRSIVRPGLSLMATKVALTAEEFRENSQRSIDLFNTEKLSTDSTHVLKSAYCILCISAVAICTGRVEAKSRFLLFRQHRYRCNLHGACGGKGPSRSAELPAAALQSARGVWRQSTNSFLSCGRSRVAICTGRVEAKLCGAAGAQGGARCNLHGACGGKGHNHAVAIDCFRLQSARSVWRQRFR